MRDEEILLRRETPEERPSGICIQYAEGFGEVTEAVVRKILKNVRKGVYQHLYLALDPGGESTFLQMAAGGGCIALSIGEERCQENRVSWTVYQSYDPRYSVSAEAAPIRWGQDVFLKRYTIQDPALALRGIEWFIRTGTPYPGMDWARHSGFPSNSG